MPQGAPAPGEQSEATFAEAAQAAQQHVVGAGVRVEHLAVGGLFDWGEYTDARTVVAVVGQPGQVELGVGPVQGAEDVFAGLPGSSGTTWSAEAALSSTISIRRPATMPCAHPVHRRGRRLDDSGRLGHSGWREPTARDPSLTSGWARQPAAGSPM